MRKRYASWSVRSESRSSQRHAALGRMGIVGAWDRLRAGEALEGLELADAELLVAAGLLARIGPDRFIVNDDDLELDGAIVGHAMVAQLRRALEHTERRSVGWDGANPETVLHQGRSSRAVSDHIAQVLLPQMPESRSAIEGGPARFLDVGVGVAAVSAWVSPRPGRGRSGPPRAARGCRRAGGPWWTAHRGSGRPRGQRARSADSCDSTMPPVPCSARVRFVPCWWARLTVESTLPCQPSSPAASA